MTEKENNYFMPINFYAYFYLALAVFCFHFLFPKKYKNPHVEIQTRSGDIEVELSRQCTQKRGCFFSEY